MYFWDPRKLVRYIEVPYIQLQYQIAVSISQVTRHNVPFYSIRPCPTHRHNTFDNSHSHKTSQQSEMLMLRTAFLCLSDRLMMLL